MASTLIDAGPMISLFDKSDRYHNTILSCLAGYQGHLVTTWPVITEAAHMLSFDVGAQINLLQWINRGALQIAYLGVQHLGRLIELLHKYSDLPMDLADGSLIVVSEFMNLADIITIDADYYVYRAHGKRAFNNILSEYL